jgi:hypothetical protein
MSASMSSRQKGERFRELVLLYFASRGLTKLSAQVSFESLDEALAALEVLDGGSVFGSPLTIVTRNYKALRWSEALNQANKSAASSSSLGGVVVQRRAGSQIDGAYAVMDLSTLSKILLKLEAK